MKTTVPYNFIKFLAGIMLVAVPVFVACKKDPVEPNNPNNPQPQQRTEEFIYNLNLRFCRPGSSNEIPYAAFADTVAKLADNGAVKTIHITPKGPHMFGTLPSASVETRANMLDNMYGQSNGKLSGENTTLALDAEALQNQTVQSVLHNKLKIELEQYSK